MIATTCITQAPTGDSLGRQFQLPDLTEAGTEGIEARELKGLMCVLVCVFVSVSGVCVYLVSVYIQASVCLCVYVYLCIYVCVTICM